MSTKQIASSTLWQLGSQITMAALSIITVKFVAIGLSKELAGNYNSAYGFLQLFGILADFGLYAVAIREVSREEAEREKVLGVLIVIRSCIVVASLSLALLVAWLLPQWNGTPLPIGVTIAAFVPFFTLLAGIIRTVFQVHYKMHFVFLAEVTQRIITTSLIGFFVITGVRNSIDISVYKMFLGFGGFGAFVLFAISVLSGNSLMRIRPHFDWNLMKQLLQKAAPYGIAFFCMALYRQFDITIIAMLRPDFEIQNAYYGFVNRMTDMGFLIPTFLLNSTLPILSERDAKGEDTSALLGKTLLILLILGSVSALFSALWSRPLVQLLTTESYLSTPTQAGSDTALQWMSIPLFLNSFVLYSFYILLTKHKWKQLVMTLLLAAVGSVTINANVIPEYGFMGAVFTSSVVHLFLSIALLPQALHTMPTTLSLQQIGRWLLFVVLLATALHLIRPWLGNELYTAAGLVLMSGCIVVFAYVSGLLGTLGVLGKKA